MTDRTETTVDDLYPKITKCMAQCRFK